MFHYVYNAALKSDFDVFLAICDKEIEEYCQKINSIIMTDPNHPSGSDRIGEAIKNLENQKF